MWGGSWFISECISNVLILTWKTNQEQVWLRKALKLNITHILSHMFNGDKLNLPEGVGVNFCANIALIFEEFSSSKTNYTAFPLSKSPNRLSCQRSLLESEKHTPPRGWRTFASATLPSWHLYLTFISFFHFENLNVNLLRLHSTCRCANYTYLYRNVSDVNKRNYYSTCHLKLYTGLITGWAWMCACL